MIRRDGDRRTEPAPWVNRGAWRLKNILRYSPPTLPATSRMLAMPATANSVLATRTVALDPGRIKPNHFSISIYGDPSAEIDDLLPSIREHGILVAMVVAPGPRPGTWEVLSGHRRLACALALDLAEVPCEVRRIPPGAARRRAILEYNRQRRKTFSQLMREADALEELWGSEASLRRLANLRQGQAGSTNPPGDTECRNSDARMACGDFEQESGNDGPIPPPASRGRTDAGIARHLGMGGKDLYRQARAIWRMAGSGDARARNGVTQLDAGTKTIHAAYKDLRRRDRFSADFRPTPYDVWSFRHDRAFGIPHPGSIPPALVAHTLHYYTSPGALVVDPMAGGGTTIDVCQSMGRRCLAYDLHPTRPEIQPHDVHLGLPPEAADCDLVFCDPPYHTMLARRYARDGIANAPLSEWIAFLHDLARHAFAALRPGGCLALLLAPQTEKDLPVGFGYLDHAFFGYFAATQAGFLPERRISCPMDGAYLPQQVRRAREEGRLLGQVRDLLIMRKPSHIRDTYPEATRISPEIHAFLPV
jgi:ParB family transcriptional regulator, chromosome partitioning protein